MSVIDTVEVYVHREPEGWWAESPAAPGWSATAKSYPELRGLITEGLEFAIGRTPGQIREVMVPPAPPATVG